jgi:DNA-binding transcriptional MerR regulator
MLVTTAELARELSLAPRTIQHYRLNLGLVPDLVTAGGHARWDVEKVREWLRDSARKKAQQGVETQTDRDPGDAGQDDR